MRRENFKALIREHLGSYRDIIEGWLQCLEAFAAFRRMIPLDLCTNSHADLREIFSSGISLGLTRIVRSMRMKIVTWRCGANPTMERFSSGVADFLLVMTDWMDVTKGDGLQESLAEVNNFLFRWLE